MAAPVKIPKPLELQKFGLGSTAQWLLIAPSRYEDYTIVTDDYPSLDVDSVVVISGEIIQKNMFDEYKRPTNSIHAAVRLTVDLRNEKGDVISVTAFGRPGYEWQHSGLNSKVVVRGTVSVFNNSNQIKNPTLVPSSKFGKVLPVYASMRQTAGERFANVVRENMQWSDVAGDLIEAETGWKDPRSPINIPKFIGFSSGQSLIQSLHDPKTLAEGILAINAARLLSAISLVKKAADQKASIQPNAKSMVPVTNAIIQETLSCLPFPPTGDQRRAVEDIGNALRSPYALDGLLSGDVGSGKTATFLVPLVASWKVGMRCMILTPNLLLIKQVAAEIRAYFPGVDVCTVTGGGVNGDPLSSIIVGTTAILGAFKKKKLGLAPHVLVIDEQHRFSVEQREVITANFTNVIEATATPIPRTAALAAYGNKTLFVLRDIPVVKDIQTTIAFRQDAKNVRNFLLEAVRGGVDQAAVIYPLVGAADVDNGLRSVHEAYENWKRFIPEEQIAVLHGKMTDDEKEEVIRAFKAGEKRFMIASTVIEVGITLPDLKRLMVVGADKFGLVTLHQLRGRLARHGGEGDFLLFVEDEDSESLERLQILVDHIDGFTVAEKDAEQRGFGDFLSVDGDSQSGKTRTLFMGVKVGPLEIDRASQELDIASKTANTKMKL